MANNFGDHIVHVNDFSNAFITVLNSPHEKVSYNVFNVGHTDENYTKQMLVNEIKKVLPNSKIKYVAKMRTQEIIELIVIK